MSEIQNNCATLRLRDTATARHCDCATLRLRDTATVRLCDGELPSVEPSQLTKRVLAITHREQVGIATARNQVIGIGAFRREAL
jgi:hypothetical protein